MGSEKKFSSGLSTSSPAAPGSPGVAPSLAAPSLDDIIKGTVRKIETVRDVMDSKPLGGIVLQTPEMGFPIMVKCPKHGTMLMSTSTITWTEAGKRVYYCLLCWKEHEQREMLKKVKEVCKKCEPVDFKQKSNGPILRPRLKGDISRVGRK